MADSVADGAGGGEEGEDRERDDGGGKGSWDLHVVVFFFFFRGKEGGLSGDETERGASEGFLLVL